MSNARYNLFPSKPAFCARRSGFFSVVTNTKVTFTNNIVNDSNNYANSRFTAPVAGNYCFAINLRLGHTGALRVITLALRKNGSAIFGREFGNGGGNDYASGSDHTYVTGSTIIPLAENDYIELYTGSEITFSGNCDIQDSVGSSHFSGYLVS